MKVLKSHNSTSECSWYQRLHDNAWNNRRLVWRGCEILWWNWYLQSVHLTPACGCHKICHKSKFKDILRRRSARWLAGIGRVMTENESERNSRPTEDRSYGCKWAKKKEKDRRRIEDDTLPQELQSSQWRRSATPTVFPWVHSEQAVYDDIMIKSDESHQHNESKSNEHGFNVRNMGAPTCTVFL